MKIKDIGKIKRDEYECDCCHQTFSYINNETWNDKKAKDEYVENWPNEQHHELSIICDDCNSSFLKWYNSLSKSEKDKLQEEANLDQKM